MAKFTGGTRNDTPTGDHGSDLQFGRAGNDFLAGGLGDNARHGAADLHPGTVASDGERKSGTNGSLS